MNTNSNFTDGIKKIKEEFPKFIKETSLEFNRRLSAKYNANIFLKNEYEQVIRSYKIRGVFNLINSLDQKQRKKGIVCASAGNHSQGFAYCCRHFRIKGFIYMPKTTPSQKIKAAKEFGGKFVEIILMGNVFDDSLKEAQKFSKENNLVLVSPFNHIDIIKGQGTIGLEIFNQFKDIKPNEKIDYLFLPIGGGGLSAGISEVFREMSPKTKIIGVEPKGAPSCYQSLKNKEIIELEKIDTFVDGASVKEIGNICFKYIKKNILKVNLVDENRLCSSILYFLEKEGKVIEPAGILSIDALKDFKKEIKKKNIICVVSGSNFDFGRLQEVKERSMKFEGLKKYIIFKFPQRYGFTREFLNLLEGDMDIVRFDYLKKTNKELGSVLIGFETTDKKNFKIFFKNLEKNNIEYEDITNDDLLFDLIV